MGDRTNTVRKWRRWHELCRDKKKRHRARRCLEKSVPQVMSGSVTSFRSSSATASSGNGALVDKRRLLPAISWGRNAAPKLAHTASTHP